VLGHFPIALFPIVLRRGVGEKEAGDLAAGAEEEEADAGAGQAGDLSDLAVGVALSVGEPEELAVAGAHLGESRAEDGLRVGLGRAGGGGEEVFREFLNGGGAGTAPVVAEQVGGDTEEVTAGGDFALGQKRLRARGAKEADEALLHEVVGEGGVG
jgi:hypothetical protein